MTREEVQKRIRQIQANQENQEPTDSLLSGLLSELCRETEWQQAKIDLLQKQLDEFRPHSYGEELVLVIMQQGVKRSVKGDFKVYLNRRSAEIIAATLQARLADEDFLFGFIDIRDDLRGLVELKEKGWAE